MDKFTVEQARKLSSLSVREMAKRIGLSQNAYYKKEKGLSRFYYDEALKFSEIVNIPIDSIFFTQNVTQKWNYRKETNGKVTNTQRGIRDIRTHQR